MDDGTPTTQWSPPTEHGLPPVAAVPAPAVGDMLLGRYRLERVIASGGMGTVWQAEDASLGRRVAVKVLQPAFAASDESRDRFRAEARNAARLNHPAVATVYDWFDGDERSPAFLVLEYVDGGALSELLRSSAPLPPARVAEVLAGAAGALAAAHAGGLVHRDVKPANLLLTADGRVKLTDFGIAEALRAPGGAPEGFVLGTPYYLAPEQATAAPTTPAADVYGLGVMGYEMLAGHRPFDGTPLEVVAAHREQQPPPLPGESGAVGELVTAMLAKDPAARPTADEVARRARELAGHGGAVPVPVPVQRRRRTSRVAVLLAVPLAVAGAAVGARGLGGVGGPPAAATAATPPHAPAAQVTPAAVPSVAASSSPAPENNVSVVTVASQPASSPSPSSPTPTASPTPSKPKNAAPEVASTPAASPSPASPAPTASPSPTQTSSPAPPPNGGSTPSPSPSPSASPAA